MPSLNELTTFKNSFQDIGGEKKRAEDSGEPVNDLALPEVEGAPLQAAEPAAGGPRPSPSVAADSGQQNGLAEEPPQEAPLEAADLDDGLPQEASLEGAEFDDSPLEEASLEAIDLDDEPLEEASLEGINLDDEPLEEGSLEGIDLDFEMPQEASLDEFDELSFEADGQGGVLAGEADGSLDDFTDASSLAEDDFAFNGQGNAALDLDFGTFLNANPDGPSGPPAGEDPADGLKESGDGGGESPEAQAPPRGGLFGRSMEYRPESERLEMGYPPREPQAKDGQDDPPLEEKDIDFDAESGTDEGELSIDGEPPLEEAASEDFDDFSFGDESADLKDLGGEAAPSGGEPESGALDADFVIPEIDDLISGKDEKAQAAASSLASVEGDFSDGAEEVEEIQLSEKDLESLQETLAGYPLNLKIACQEIIAEHVVEPEKLSKLLKMLIRGAPAKETAALASEILDRRIVVPKSFQKSTGEELEAEQSSFTYIFVKRFLPVLRLFSVIAVLAACIAFLSHRFIFIPQRAEGLYRQGYEQIHAGNFDRADELFWQAFSVHPNINWFYRFAEAYRDQRMFLLAVQKYEALLWHFPGDRRGILDFAYLQTFYLMNFERASEILRHNLLDFNPVDFDGLLALGDNYFAWADSNPILYYEMYENARAAFATLLETAGWQPPVVERMMRYFIRTDNLREVLFLNDWFHAAAGRDLSGMALAEVAGYLLDRRLQTPAGVPSAYLESIDGAVLLDMLIRAVQLDPSQPEPHYHLARYFGSFGNVNIHEERVTLENAILAFDIAVYESVRRRLMRIDAHRMYADLLVRSREFFAAEYNLMRAIALYEDFLARGLIVPSPEMGRLFADMGDLEFFVKAGDMEMALHYYRIALEKGWVPPEMLYRMGAAYYELEDWAPAMDFLFRASADLPLNRRLLFALGNASFQRGDFFAAQGFYGRLLEILEAQRALLPALLPNDNPAFLETGERLMMARNNAGVVYELLAAQTGNPAFLTRAMDLFSESAGAWDSITRNPATMTRESPIGDFDTPGVNLAFLNLSNALNINREFPPAIFVSIDRDVLEPSRWEPLLPNPLLGESFGAGGW